MEKLNFKAGTSVGSEKLVKMLVANPAFAQEVIKGLKDAGVKAPKKEKEIVAVRVQLKDTSPTARKVRKAGEEFPLSEQALLLTLRTWVKGKDADKTIDEHLTALASGQEVEFTSFKLVGIA